MKVEYSSNNSGGSWWLSPDDWRALEEAGWNVEWGGLYFCHSRWNFCRAPAGAFEPCATAEECQGHRRFSSYAEALEHKSDWWLGAPAESAAKDFDTVEDAIREFESVTGQTASDEGCNCCGPPHSFSWDDGYASGSDCVGVLYPGAPSSLREAAERLAGA